MSFAFPTLAPRPEPIWRPPPYPAPWSLRPEDHYWLARPLASDQANWPLPDYRYGGTYFGSLQVHAGIDMDAPVGTAVLAAASGKVVWAGWGLLLRIPGASDDYGQAVAIEHDFGLEGNRVFTLYAHLSQVDVVPDETVVAGQKVGEVGLTGYTFGDHLHFEVRLGINHILNTRNPELWLTPPQGWGVLAGRVLDAQGQPVLSHPVYVRSLDAGAFWQVWTYAPEMAFSDQYYAENFVIGDLPGGRYEIRTEYRSRQWGRQSYSLEIDLLPGVTTLVLFDPVVGFRLEPRASPQPLPPAVLRYPGK